MKKILALLLLSLVLFTAVSCGKAPTAEEIRPTLEALVEASYEINDIFFGEGLPSIARDSEYAINNYVYYMDEGGSNYDYVSPESPYQSTEEIKAAAEKVYSSEYLASIYETSFIGVADPNAGMLYARYLDTDEGLKKSNLHQAIITSKRIYDFDSMAVVKPSGTDYVNIEIDSHTEGSSDVLRIRLTLVNENGEWRLDTPTY